MFASDSSLSASGNNIAAINAELQPSSQEVTEWCSVNAILLNPEKTKSMVVATRQKHQRGLPPLRLMLNSQVIEQVSEHCHLGLFLMTSLNGKLILTVLLTLLLKMCICSLASDTFVIHFFHAHIISRNNYVSNLWDGCSGCTYLKICTQTCSQSSLCYFAMANWTRAHFLWSVTFKRYNKCILVH